MKRSRLTILSLLTLVSTLVLPVVAIPPESDVETLETVIVTATRLATPVTELTPSIEIITREQIDNRHASSVTELLRHVAGTNIIQQGGRGGVTSFLLRGGEANFTVVLIDGVKVNDSTNTRGGSYDFTNLDLADVGRIEIVRGPMSALYGSDALAGVVNIITRNDPSGGDFVIEGGSDGYASAKASVGGRHGKVAAGLNFHFLNDDGALEGADYEGWGTSGKMTAEISQQTEAELVFRLQNSESTSFPEDSGGPRLAVLRQIDSREMEESHLRVSLRNELFNSWHLHIAGSHYRRDETTASPGIAPGVFDGVPPNSAETEFYRNQFVANIRGDVSTCLSFLVGGEWQKEKGESIGVIDIGFPVPANFKLDRDTFGAFSEISYQSGSFFLQGGLRWDNPDGIAGEAIARAGALYQFSDDVTEFRVNWGQGFKAPSFFAIAHPLVGNPDLKVETATSVDMILTRRIWDSKGDIGVSVYRNEYENLIDFDPALFRNVNRSHVVTQGVELTMALNLSETVDFRAHLTYLDSAIEDRHQPGRPEWQGGAVIGWKVRDNWRLVTSLLVLDKFYESSIPTGGLFLNGYKRLDAALTYEPRENVSLRFAIDNLFDEDYEEVLGFPAAGIRGRLGLRYNF